MTSVTQAGALLTLAALHLYPVKSCAGVQVSEALLIETGLEFDRAWMVVDEQGDFVSQRQLPRMALIQPTLRLDDMVLRAPGMLALHVALDAVEGPAHARVRGEEVKAYDMGPLAAQWFSDLLGTPLRMVRVDPEQQRPSNTQGSGTSLDAFPLLVTSTASLADLNQRHAPQEEGEGTHFRPNLVVDGLAAHGEEALDEIQFDTDEGPVTLKLVTPYPPGDGAIGHGMSAVIVEGIERPLRVGHAGVGRRKSLTT